MVQIYSPNTIDIVWACPGGGSAPQCNPSNLAERLTQTFGSGDADPVMIAGGSTLGTSPSTDLATLVVFKIMQYNSGSSTWDTTFHTAALNPNASWTGADACGTKSGIGYMRYRGDGPNGSPPNFTTAAASSTTACCSLNYQYLVSGLSAGRYNVTLNGSGITNGSNCTGGVCLVSAGDTTIEFTGAAGSVAFGAASGGGTTTAGQTKAVGQTKHQ
jgi:hypothetical protein